MNLRVRMKNKLFWVTMVPMVLVLVRKILIIFGVDVDLSILSQQLVDVIETIFVILGLLGVAVDPTTYGLGDSEQAMGYIEPRKDE